MFGNVTSSPNYTYLHQTQHEPVTQLRLGGGEGVVVSEHVGYLDIGIIAGLRAPATATATSPNRQMLVLVVKWSFNHSIGVAME